LTGIGNVAGNIRHIKIPNVQYSCNPLSQTLKFVFITLIITLLEFAIMQYTKRTNDDSVNRVVLLFKNYGDISGNPDNELIEVINKCSYFMYFRKYAVRKTFINTQSDYILL